MECRVRNNAYQSLLAKHKNENKIQKIYLYKAPHIKGTIFSISMNDTRLHCA